MDAIQGCGYLFFVDNSSTPGTVGGGISLIAGGIIEAFIQNYHKAEYVCYKSMLVGSNAVSIFLQAAAAIA